MSAPASLLERANELADQMEMLGVDFDYFGGLNAAMHSLSHELLAAAITLRQRAQEMRLDE